jgi:oligoribonuclease NrnB/cAMP/cGMP phosphodiesterase (DHH superfamily)
VILHHLRIDGIVSHWDIDGIASAAILAHTYAITIDNIYLSSTNKIFDYYKKLKKKKVNHVFITDLNPSASIAKKFSEEKKGGGITWIDHHEWHPDAIELLSKKHNVKLMVDPNQPCTARIIVDRLLDRINIPEPFIMLSELAEDDDTFSNRIELTMKWRLLLRWGDWSFRYRVLESWIDGIIWPEWAEIEYEKVYTEYKKLLEKTFATLEIKKIGDSIVVFAYPNERIHPGDLQVFIEKKTGNIADAYVFFYNKGVSLRSGSIDVSKIAKELGGGGHKRAAGATLQSEERESLKQRIISFFAKMVKRS